MPPVTRGRVEFKATAANHADTGGRNAGVDRRGACGPGAEETKPRVDQHATPDSFPVSHRKTCLKDHMKRSYNASGSRIRTQFWTRRPSISNTVCID